MSFAKVESYWREGSKVTPRRSESVPPKVVERRGFALKKLKDNIRCSVQSTS